MTRLLFVAILATFATISSAGDQFRLSRGTDGAHHGAPIGAAKALGDTLYLIGNPENPIHYDQTGTGPQAVGTFVDESGQPSWNGWTSVDHTLSDTAYWQVSDFLPLSGQYSYWCGTDFAGDPGYGNNWVQGILFTHTVADPTVASTVDWSFTLQHELEVGYDFAYVEWNQGGEWTLLEDGDFTGDGTVAFAETWTVQPADYAGDGYDEIQLRIQVVTDSAYSDEDQLIDTDGAGRADDITVTVDGQLVDFEDFEDQDAGRWVAQFGPSVGDYARLYMNLMDEDPCARNASAQVAFIDDGEVVPGTGGTPGQTWRYGPGGYIVNNTGGLAGDGYYLENSIVSPVLEWPAGLPGARLACDVYRHEAFRNPWPGIVYRWQVRSVDTGDPADLADAPLVSDGQAFFGDPLYLKFEEDIATYLVPGCTHVQILLTVQELGFQFEVDGTDGTPAPYFDNVRLAAFPFAGPAITSRPLEHYQDAFPASGTIDLVDLGSNHVPLDMALDISYQHDGLIDPGDSLVFEAAPIRAGAVMTEHPRVHLRLRANPLFDPYRSLPSGLSLTAGHFEDGWSLIEGSVVADSCFFTSSGDPVWIPGRWQLDLPDQHFFYPGDVLRWCIEASDNVAGDVGITLMPADTSGFADFSAPLRYPRDFSVRALPTLFTDTPGDQPQILFWNDSGQILGAWRFALGNLGRWQGRHYDVYVTKDAENERGNGLGGRATAAQLAGYEVLLYTSGTLEGVVLGDGSSQEAASPDIQLLTNWFDQGGRSALFTGSNVASGLAETAAGSAFLQDHLGVEFMSDELAPLINLQHSPLVRTIEGNYFIQLVDEWVAFGGCPILPRFDAVNAIGSSERLAEFTDPYGDGDTYPYAAGIANQVPDIDATLVYLPYDLQAIINAPGWTPPAGLEGLPARALILKDLLDRFGQFSYGVPIGSPAPEARLAARAYPNPFNPATTIELTIPRTGEVSLKVYDLRGSLVRTLVAGELAAGSHQVVWDGTDDTGGAVASGVYFHETRAGGEVSLGKLTMVK